MGMSLGAHPAPARRTHSGSWIRAVVISLGMLAIPAAHAGDWSSPEWSLWIAGKSTSNLFPGSASTGPDRGAEARASLGTAWRGLPQLKLGIEGRAGGEYWSRFEIARYAWLGAETSLRHGNSQLVVEGEWTPRRVKFEDEEGLAEYRRLEWRAGVRQGLPLGFRARLEGRFRDDDFVQEFDERDAVGRGFDARLAWRPTDVFTVRAELEAGRSEATVSKYTKEEREASGGATWRPGATRVEADVHSGVRRYTDAGPSDSNFRRRDQWIEVSATIGRALIPGLELAAGATLLDQTSSRLDRKWTIYGFRLSLEWSASGE